MNPSTTAAHLQCQIEVQLELAALATIDKIRAMHEDLEKLYRAQLVAVLLADKLVVAEVAVPLVTVAQVDPDPSVFPAHLAASAIAHGEGNRA